MGRVVASGRVVSIGNPNVLPNNICEGNLPFPKVGFEIFFNRLNCLWPILGVDDAWGRYQLEPCE